MRIDNTGRVIDFEEKPARPLAIPGRDDRALASMGIYAASIDVLDRLLARDADDPASCHDFGHDILPRALADGLLAVHHFDAGCVRAAGQAVYWRDVGTVDAYWAAQMDLVAIQPAFNLYNVQWPIRTGYNHDPPAKFVFNEDGPGGKRRMGYATNSLVSEACIISGGHVNRSVLGPRVRVNSYAEVEASILHEGVDIGRYCRLRACIIDKNVRVPAGTVIGYDHEADARRFQVTDGIVVIPKGFDFG